MSKAERRRINRKIAALMKKWSGYGSWPALNEFRTWLKGQK